MNRHLARIVASVTAVSVLSLVGAGLASAATATLVPPGTPVAQSVEKLKAFHTEIDTALRDHDAKTLLDSVTRLRPALTEVKGIARTQETIHLVDEADDTAQQIQAALPLPGLPDPVQAVTGLVGSLLALLQGLIGSLLGSLPIPIPLPLPLPGAGAPAPGAAPVPGLPPLPVPLPLPGAGAPAPGAAPLPVPLPIPPVPGVPEVPGVPVPEVPAPGLPVPGLPVPLPTPAP
ncbi:hypothetical protein [Actinokineospora sp.]|uniref:hypothetical protein n=1 Tax=Actinokineospora sp. TaxID=1872133 RepID=UPI0040376171